MKIISRRDFLKISAFTVATIFTQSRLPIFSSGKTFKPFKFAFIPDIHLSSSRFDDWIMKNESLILYQDAIKLINEQDLDFVLFGGDQIDNQNRDLSDLSMFIDVICQLEKPYYVLFGDREARLNNNYSKEDFAVEFRRNGFITKGRTYWDHKPVEGLELIGLDSSVINKMDGEVSPDQLVWLASKLRESNQNFKIIALHHPLIPASDETAFLNGKGFQLNNSSTIIDIINRAGNVDLILSGHHHINYITTNNNVHYVNSPSISTYPCEFRIIEVTDTFIEIKNVKITYKQIIKKAKEDLINSSYAQNFNGVKPKSIPKLHYGSKKDRFAKIKI